LKRKLHETDREDNFLRFSGDGAYIFILMTLMLPSIGDATDFNTIEGYAAGVFGDANHVSAKDISVFNMTYGTYGLDRNDSLYNYNVSTLNVNWYVQPEDNTVEVVGLVLSNIFKSAQIVLDKYPEIDEFHASIYSTKPDYEYITGATYIQTAVFENQLKKLKKLGKEISISETNSLPVIRNSTNFAAIERYAEGVFADANDVNITMFNNTQYSFNIGDYNVSTLNVNLYIQSKDNTVGGIGSVLSNIFKSAQIVLYKYPEIDEFHVNIYSPKPNSRTLTMAYYIQNDKYKELKSKTVRSAYPPNKASYYLENSIFSI
jgi:hypothetical protein